MHYPDAKSFVFIAGGIGGESGFVTKEILERYLPPSRESGGFEIFLCGPEPLTNAVEKALVEPGVFIGNFHAERFDLV